MDDRPRADLDTGKNGSVRTNVDILTNRNFGGDESATATLHALGISWHPYRVDGDTSAYSGVPPNRDSARIHEFAARSNSDHLTDDQIVSVVAMERCIDEDFGADMSSHVGRRTAIGVVHVGTWDPFCSHEGLKMSVPLLPGDLHAFVACHIETEYNIAAMLTLSQQQVVIRRERLAAQHLVFLGLLPSGWRWWGIM